jgi:hypothetical protein
MPKFYTSINLNNNQLQNVSLNPQASTPGTYAAGLIYFDTNAANTSTYNRLIIRNAANGAWLNIPYSGSIVNADISSSAAITISKLDTTSVRQDTIGAATSTISAGTSGIPQKIQYVADPTADNDAANKKYVDAAVANLNIHAPAVVATTTALTGGTGASGGGVGATLNFSTGVSGGVLTIDGINSSGTGANGTYALQTGDRILVKNQGGANGTSNVNNGVYTITTIASTTATITRDTDYDGSVTGEVANGDYIFTLYGSQKSTAWIQSAANPLTVGTSSLSFTQFTQLASYTASNGVKLTSGTNFELDNTTVPSGMKTGTGNFVLDTSPTLATPTIGVATATSVNKVAITAPTSSATLTLADGSTLATSGAYSTTLTATGTTSVTLPTSGTLATIPTGTGKSLPTKYITNVTFSSTTATITHSLSTKDVIVQVYDSSDNQVFFDVNTTSTSQVTITNASADGLTYRVVVVG